MPISRKLAIKLALHGCANRPFYHVVVMLKHKGRDKPPIEQLGTYDPMKNDNNEVLIALNYDRIKFWMTKGARPTQSVEKLLGVGILLYRKGYIQRVLVKATNSYSLCNVV